MALVLRDSSERWRLDDPCAPDTEVEETGGTSPSFVAPSVAAIICRQAYNLARSLTALQSSYFGRMLLCALAAGRSPLLLTWRGSDETQEVGQKRLRRSENDRADRLFERECANEGAERPAKKLRSIAINVLRRVRLSLPLLGTGSEAERSHLKRPRE
jgi:hypothetical protein